MTNTREWEDLIYGKIKRLLYTEIPYNAFAWYKIDSPYEDPSRGHRRKIDEMVEKIAWDVKEYCNKLADDVCKQHHEDHELDER